MLIKTKFDIGDRVEVMVRNFIKETCPCCGTIKNSYSGFVYKPGVVDNLSFDYSEGEIIAEEYYVKLASGELAFSFPEGVRLLEGKENESKEKK